MVLQAELLRDAVALADPAATDLLRFSDVVPDARGGYLDVDSARLAIAKDHWYAGWAIDTVDTRFEAAADAIHAGDLGTLRRMATRWSHHAGK